MAGNSVQTQQIEIPYPDTPSVDLEISVGAPGNVRVGGGAIGRFVAGTIEFDREAWAPRIEQRGSRVRVAQAERAEDKFDFSFDAVNRWDLHLGAEKPFSLEIRCGVNRGRWDLGGLPITDLLIETGVSENSFTFDSPNPGEMRSLELRCGVASVEMEGLLNANFRRMAVKGGVGSVTLGLTGAELKQDARVKIEGGVGQFVLVVDARVPAQARITGLVGVTARGGFQRRSGGAPFGGSYETPNYAAASGPRLEIEISAGISGIVLDTR